ncbi:MAG: hypothetical protein IKV89_04065 [Clostridia bacterium]|nr:hypothetical protein [Clostridia bacterium]
MLFLIKLQTKIYNLLNFIGTNRKAVCSFFVFCYPRTSPSARRKLSLWFKFFAKLKLLARLLLTPKSLATFGGPAKSPDFVGRGKAREQVQFLPTRQNKAMWTLL